MEKNNIIGIITMHRVLNFGSVLQAYALQYKLNSLNRYSEIIDYEFPSKKNVRLLEHINLYFRELIYRIRVGTFFKKRKRKYFKAFIRNNLTISNETYNNSTIKKASNKYGFLLTGSDQVWNPRWIKDDTNFFLAFANDNIPRASFASSFTVKEIPDNYKELYASQLKKYRNITVREQSSILIIEKLIGKKAKLVCDPTLLLTAKEYHLLEKQSTLHVKEDYILVYLMSYMFEPYPEANKIVENVRKELGIKVIYLSGSKFSRLDKDCKVIEDIGPNEFVWLFKHATFVITTSFHGTAFAAIFQKPLLSLIKSHENDNDERITSFLRKLGNEKSIVEFDSNYSIHKSQLKDYIPSPEKLDAFRNESIKILKDIVQ